MIFEAIKTKAQLRREQEVPINYVEFTLLVKDSKKKGENEYEKKVELVYKRRGVDINSDKYLLSRLRDYGKLKKAAIFRIKNMKIIKSMSTGTYEG